MIESIPLEHIIRTHPRKGVTLSEKRTRQYSLDYVHRGLVESQQWQRVRKSPWFLCKKGNRQYKIWLDAQHALVLNHKKHPQALAAFENIDGKLLHITQLQGIRPAVVDSFGNKVKRGHNRGLTPIDWEAILVESIAEFAKGLGTREIAIQPGMQNYWHKRIDRYGDPILPLDDAIRRYDDTALRCGFELESRDGLTAYFRSAMGSH